MADDHQSVKLHLRLHAGRLPVSLHRRSALTAPYFLWLHPQNMGTYFHSVLVG